MTRVAAVDCGTNTIRLLVTDIDPATGAQKDWVREMRIVRLGQGVDRTGRLADEALSRVFAAVEEYAALFAVFMPFDGKSPVVVAVIAAGFLVAALAYWLSAGGSPADGSPAEPVSSETGPSPSAAAHRSSS